LVNKDIQALDGQLVELNIQQQEYSLRAANLDVANKFWEKLRPTKIKIPDANLKERRLLNVSELKLASTVFAGVKAAQLGEVANINPPLVTPGGFVVPLAYYFDHLGKPTIAALFDTVVDDKNPDTAIESHYVQLDALRVAIESTPVDATLIAAIKTKMLESGHNGRWILRSSTNAEDLAGFNGAGLYRSIKIKANATDAELIDALRKVWASVWLQTAFDERAWYGVDHRTVGMAVLVQPFVEGAIANGVAISANPFAEFRPGVLINAQPSGGSVTGAAGDEIPEQHLVYTFTEELDFEFLSKSSRMPDGKIILNKAILTDLTNQLVSLHKHFMHRWDDRANAVDVEFLVMPDQKIVILQARPYKVIYNKEQRI
jgi:phosphoenolpyruvate synthase/pyruvate phosphate dikinase